MANDKSQADKFRETARELEADENPEAFDKAFHKIVKAPDPMTTLAASERKILEVLSNHITAVKLPDVNVSALGKLQREGFVRCVDSDAGAKYEMTDAGLAALSAP